MKTQKIGNIILFLMVLSVWIVNTFINWNTYAFIVMLLMVGVSGLNVYSDYKKK